MIKKWAKELKRPLTKEAIQRANKHMKRCSTSYVIREMLNKTTMTYHRISIRMVEIWNTDNIECSWGCGAIGTLIHCRRECKMVQPLWKKFIDFLWNNHVLTIQSNNHTSWHSPKEDENLCAHKNLHVDVYSSFIHYCQNQDVLQWVSDYNGILFGAKSKWAMKPWRDTEEL